MEFLQEGRSSCRPSVEEAQPQHAFQLHHWDSLFVTVLEATPGPTCADLTRVLGHTIDRLSASFNESCKTKQKGNPF